MGLHDDIKSLIELIENGDFSEENKAIAKRVDDWVESPSGLIPDTEVHDIKPLECPKCHKTETLYDWTYLQAGFNGINEGEKDDINKLECVHCGMVVDYPEMEE